MKRSVLGVVALAITLPVLIVLLPATRAEDPCDRLSDAPVFQIVADHGAASYAA